MNEARRERIRELIRMLETVEEQIHSHLQEEEAAFGGRSQSSKDTDLGRVSEQAVEFLDHADTDIENAIEQLRFAVGDDMPEPAPSIPIRRRL